MRNEFYQINEKPQGNYKIAMMEKISGRKRDGRCIKKRKRGGAELVASYLA